MLIKIGDFARQTGATIKALRHYEQLHLLKPAWINRFNGYRYYAPEQQDQLGKLLAYKELGFSLTQISSLLDERLSEAEFQRMLEERVKELEEHIRRESSRLEKAGACLARARQGGRREAESSLSIPRKIPTKERLEEKMEIQIKDLPALKLVGLRYQGRNEHNEIAITWSTFNRKAEQIKHFTGEAAYGVCSLPAGLPDGEFAYLCAFPVETIEDIPAGMTSLELPAMRAAVFEHRGSYETLGKTYTNIYQKWLPAAGLQPLEKGLDLEVYTDAFKDFAPDSVMFIYVPIKA